MNYIVDTNIIVAAFLRDFAKINNKEIKLIELLESLPSSNLFLTDFVITEFSILVQKVIASKYELKDFSKFINLKSIKAIEFLTNEFNIYQVDDQDRKAALSLFEGLILKNPKQKEITFTDCLLVSISKNKGLKLLTLEAKLGNLAENFANFTD